MTVDITLTAPRRTRTSLGAHCRWPQRCAASAGITFARHDRSAGRAEIAKPGLRQPARGDRQRWRLAQPGIGAIRFADVDPEMAGPRRHVVPGSALVEHQRLATARPRPHRCARFERDARGAIRRLHWLTREAARPPGTAPHRNTGPAPPP